jgi:hypothetical protein
VHAWLAPLLSGGQDARFRRRSLKSNPASGEDQEADGEDAPARRMVKAVRLQGMDSHSDRSDRQSGQHRELTEGHRNAIDEVRKTSVHGKGSKVDVASQHLGRESFVFKPSEPHLLVQ